MIFKQIFSGNTSWVRGLVLLLLFWSIVSVNPMFAQAESDSTAVADEEEVPETPVARVSLVCIQAADDSIRLEATVKAKIDGAFRTLAGINVQFYRVGADSASLLGNAVTNSRGIALMKTPSADARPGEDSTVTFSAKSEPIPSLEEGEDEISFKKASLTLTPVEGDSSHEVTVLVLAGGKDGTPLPEMEVGLYVKRFFSDLKIGEGTTDENGEVVIAFPTDLPGDAQGNLNIVARVDEHEAYGNLSATIHQAWGKPVSDEAGKMPRALWSHNPPLWMVITFAILMTVVWGHFIVIIYELFRLKHETE